MDKHNRIIGLNNFKSGSAFLLGPRLVGKSTALRSFYPGSRIINLLKTEEYLSLLNIKTAVAGLKMAHLHEITVAFEFSVLTLTVPGLRAKNFKILECFRVSAPFSFSLTAVFRLNDPTKLLSLAIAEGLTIIDEIQRIPELLNEVHYLIEERGARFLMSGSSARKLRRGEVNLLGGGGS